MIVAKQKTQKKKLGVLTEQSFDKMLKNLQGKGIIVEKGMKEVVVEHPNKKYCIQFNTAEALPKLPHDCVLEKIQSSHVSEEATFRSKGGRAYKMQVGTIFLFPC